MFDDFKFNELLNQPLYDLQQLNYLEDKYLEKDISIYMDLSNYAMSDLKLDNLINIAKSFYSDDCSESCEFHQDELIVDKQELARTLLHNIIEKTIEKTKQNSVVSKNDIVEILKFMTKCILNEKSDKVINICVEHCYYCSKLLEFEFYTSEILLDQIICIFYHMPKYNLNNLTNIYKDNFQLTINNIKNKLPQITSEKKTQIDKCINDKVYEQQTQEQQQIFRPKNNNQKLIQFEFKFNRFLNPPLSDYTSLNTKYVNIDPQQYSNARLSNLALKDLICAAKYFDINNCNESSKLYTERELTRALLHKIIEEIEKNDDVSESDIEEILKFMKKCILNVNTANNNIADIYVEHCYYLLKLLKSNPYISGKILNQINSTFNSILQKELYMHLTHSYEANLKAIIKNIINDDNTSIEFQFTIKLTIKQKAQRVLDEIKKKSISIDDMNKSIDFRKTICDKTLLQILNDIIFNNDDKRSDITKNNIAFNLARLYERTLKNDLSNIVDAIKFIFIREYADLFQVYVKLLDSHTLNDEQKKIVISRARAAIERMMDLTSEQTQKKLWQYFNTIDEENFKLFSINFINVLENNIEKESAILRQKNGIKDVKDQKTITIVTTTIDLFSKFYKNINKIDINKYSELGYESFRDNLKVLHNDVVDCINNELEEIKKIKQFLLYNFLTDQENIYKNCVQILPFRNTYDMLVQFKNTKNTKMTEKIFQKILMMYHKMINKNKLYEQNKTTQIYMYLCCAYACLVLSRLIDDGDVTIVDKLATHLLLNIVSVADSFFTPILCIIQQDTFLLLTLNQHELSNILAVYEILFNIAVKCNANTFINKYDMNTNDDYMNTIKNIKNIINKQQGNIDANPKSSSELQQVLDDFVKLQNQLMEEKKSKCM